MDYELMTVTIGKFRKERTETIKIEHGKESGDIYDVQNKICIMDRPNLAVDVENFDLQYPVIETNRFGVIMPKQVVETDKYYALQIRKINKKDISLLQSININHSYTKYKKKNKRY